MEVIRADEDSGELYQHGMPFEIEEIRADGDDAGTFKGLASTFGNEDLHGDIIQRGAFKGSIRSPKKIKMLWQHDARNIVGVWDEMAETDRGLEVTGHLLLDLAQAKEAMILLKEKALDAMSIGFRIPNRNRDVEFDEDTGKRIIKKVDLWEISLVTFPANPKARISTVKQLLDDGAFPDVRTMERWLTREAGFSRSQAQVVVHEGFKALLQREADEPHQEDGDLSEALAQSATDLRGLLSTE